MKRKNGGRAWKKEVAANLSLVYRNRVEKKKVVSHSNLFSCKSGEKWWRNAKLLYNPILNDDIINFEQNYVTNWYSHVSCTVGSTHNSYVSYFDPIFTVFFIQKHPRRGKCENRRGQQNWVWGIQNKVKKRKVLDLTQIYFHAEMIEKWWRNGEWSVVEFFMMT